MSRTEFKFTIEVSGYFTEKVSKATEKKIFSKIINYIIDTNKAMCRIPFYIKQNGHTVEYSTSVVKVKVIKKDQ